jgi:hypothetical protein
MIITSHQHLTLPAATLTERSDDVGQTVASEPDDLQTTHPESVTDGLFPAFSCGCCRPEEDSHGLA